MKIYMHSSRVVLGNFLYFFKVFCEQVSWVSSGVCREGEGKGRNALRRRQRAGTSLRKLRGSHQAPRRLRVLGLS